VFPLRLHRRMRLDGDSVEEEESRFWTTNDETGETADETDDEAPFTCDDGDDSVALLCPFGRSFGRPFLSNLISSNLISSISSVLL